MVSILDLIYFFSFLYFKMNTEKLIIFALVAFVAYYAFFQKEGFGAQQTNCSSYPIGFLCKQYESKGCSINPNRSDANPDFCICADPSKGCNPDTGNKVKQAYDNLLKAQQEYQKNQTQSNKDKWIDAWKNFQATQKK